METPYQTLAAGLREIPTTWLVTGAGGFIGSNLVETLLKLDQQVVGLDNFATGHRKNLEEVRGAVSPGQWARFRFEDGDIQDAATCGRACRGAERVLHQAALGSVPRSIEDPVATHESNVSGFLNMLIAARDAGVRRFVYASSSSIYGDAPELPKVEDKIGRPLSPYAASKSINEVYAEAFLQAYGMDCIGLRYFNVFGRRQDPRGAYAAVIPLWFAALLKGETVYINGDGETSRDFCYIDNTVQANILAAMSEHPESGGKAYNVACGERTTLNELLEALVKAIESVTSSPVKPEVVYRDFRAGDIKHSLADISLAENLLGYRPVFSAEEGIAEAARWYFENVVQ